MHFRRVRMAPIDHQEVMGQHFSRTQIDHIFVAHLYTLQTKLGCSLNWALNSVELLGQRFSITQIDHIFVADLYPLQTKLGSSLNWALNSVELLSHKCLRGSDSYHSIPRRLNKWPSRVAECPLTNNKALKVYYSWIALEPDSESLSDMRISMSFAMGFL